MSRGELHFSSCCEEQAPQKLLDFQFMLRINAVTDPFRAFLNILKEFFTNKQKLGSICSPVMWNPEGERCG